MTGPVHRYNTRSSLVPSTPEVPKPTHRYYTRSSLVPSTPEEPKDKCRYNTRSSVNSTTKKNKTKKAMSVTKKVEVVKGDVDVLSKKVGKVGVTPVVKSVQRISFMGSLADNVPFGRSHVDAIQYRNNYITLKELLARRLFVEFNKEVFNNAFEDNLPILWEKKFRTTAGTTIFRQVKNSKGEQSREVTIKLSTKVVDRPQRLRDTLIHELCHAATWVIDSAAKEGHGPLWKKWVKRALTVYPELGKITTAHNMKILYKYNYLCSCGYRLQRHSKSKKILEKGCIVCQDSLFIILSRKKQNGVVLITAAETETTNAFALYVQGNYARLRTKQRTHAQVMKLLSIEYAKSKGT